MKILIHYYYTVLYSNQLLEIELTIDGKIEQKTFQIHRTNINKDMLGFLYIIIQRS